MKDGKSDPSRLKVRLRTARGRKVSSQRWLTRQLNDPYVRQAQAAGYRSRAAYKLKEIDAKYHLFKPGMRVVDLGAAPGGWTQVALQRVQAKDGSGWVCAIDLNPLEPIVGAHILQGNFLEEAVVQQMRHALEIHGEPQVHVVLSDMAAAATGHTQTDHWRIIGLVEAALEFAEEVLAPGGHFVAKVLRGGTEQELLGRVKHLFRKVAHYKPPASRPDSAEIYLVAMDYIGPTRPHEKE